MTPMKKPISLPNWSTIDLEHGPPKERVFGKFNQCLCDCELIGEKYYTEEMLLDRSEAKLNLGLLIWESSDRVQTLLNNSSWKIDPETLNWIYANFKEPLSLQQVYNIIFRNMVENGCIMALLRDKSKRFSGNAEERRAQRENILHLIIAKATMPMKSDSVKERERERLAIETPRSSLNTITQDQDWHKEADGSWTESRKRNIEVPSTISTPGSKQLLTLKSALYDLTLVPRPSSMPLKNASEMARERLSLNENRPHSAKLESPIRSISLTSAKTSVPKLPLAPPEPLSAPVGIKKVFRNKINHFKRGQENVWGEDMK